ncbi:hypothetical protein ACLB2K_041023 [Fragaria x ananassa]
MDSDDGKTTSMDSDDELADYEFIDNDSDDSNDAASHRFQNAVDMALADSECNKHENSELRLSCFFNKAHDLLKLYDRVDVPPERLLFKIPSTWQGSSCFVPTNLEILNCPLFYKCEAIKNNR